MLTGSEMNTVPGAWTAVVAAGKHKVGVRVTSRGTGLNFGPSYGEFSAYDTAAYDLMAADQVRNEAYAAALLVAAPGRVVLDIGTGAHALWAIAAARAGARHVYAIEVMPETAARARAAVAAAGLAGRVTVLEGLSTEVDLPEPAEVCVSEVIGTIGGSEGAAAVLRDASRRLLVPGGRHVPERCVTTVAAALLPDGEIAFVPSPDP